MASPNTYIKSVYIRVLCFLHIVSIRMRKCNKSCIFCSAADELGRVKSPRVAELSTALPYYFIV